MQLLGARLWFVRGCENVAGRLRHRWEASATTNFTKPRSRHQRAPSTYCFTGQNSNLKHYLTTRLTRYETDTSYQMTPCCTASLQMSRKFFLLMALAFLLETLGWLNGSVCSSSTSFSHAIDVRRFSDKSSSVHVKEYASNLTLITSRVGCGGRRCRRRSVVINVA